MNDRQKERTGAQSAPVPDQGNRHDAGQRPSPLLYLHYSNDCPSRQTDPTGALGRLLDQAVESEQAHTEAAFYHLAQASRHSRIRRALEDLAWEVGQ